MLELKKITKVYKTGDFVQKALSSVSLSFSEAEFTSILGPSGSGKTTLLNIIGGLDNYTSGDLVIDGISTKKYKDADWDAYRNHRIGFVFQSYNLIPHQSILSNVRLALTLSGVSKKEGIKRAAAALKQVGLGDHLKKRPAELSGGQMQRVAIARALVNDPDIILADEPTGALDSETSVQIMEILKAVSEKKLVIMVTHNPDLAEQYSTRIINLKDGKILSDSSRQELVYSSSLSDSADSRERTFASTREESSSSLSNASERRIQDSDGCAQPRRAQERDTRDGGLARLGRRNPGERKRAARTNRTNMSFLTALSLSLNNLLTKKLRTLLVAVAGSIGIIGIALILAVSTGFQKYIDKIQEDTMSSYPLTLREDSFDLSSFLLYDQGIDSDASEEELAEMMEKYDVAEYPLLAKAFSNVSTNDLKSFLDYYNSHASELDGSVSRVVRSYSVDPNIYAVDATEKVAKLNPSKLFSSVMGNNSLTTAYSSQASVFTQLNTPREDLEKNFEVLAGRWPENFDELVITLPAKNNLPDIMAYGLGLKDTSELSSMVQTLVAGGTISTPKSSETKYYDYSDLLALDLRLVLPADLYSFNAQYGVYEDMSEDQAFLRTVFEEKSVPLKIVGIVTGKEGSLSAQMNTGVSYTPELIEYIVNQSKDTAPVKSQLENPEKDVFSGNNFAEKASFDYKFEDLVSVDSAALEEAFDIKIDQSAVEAETASKMTEILNSVSSDITPARTRLADLLNRYAEEIYAGLETTTEIPLATLPSTLPGLPEINPADPSTSPDSSDPSANPASPDSPASDSLPTTVPAKLLESEKIPGIVEEYLSSYSVGADFSSLESDYKIPADVYRLAFSGILNSFFSTYISTYNQLDPSQTTDPEHPAALITDSLFSLSKTAFFNSEPIILAEEQLAVQMTEINSKLAVMQGVMGLTGSLANTFGQAFNISPDKIVSAFHLNFTEDELTRVMSQMLNSSEKSAKTNLIALGYQDLSAPSTIAFYFTSFDGKTNFINFLKNYNSSVSEEKEIKYTDITGILMDSVKTIVSGVSYVLIAFVSISLVVSSIMIGIITYISVYERTKEIGILRAIGASKRNVSNIFNAETFIIGLLSGLFGIAFTYLAIPLINIVLYHATNNPNIAAYLPVNNAGKLVVLSIFLTVIAGLIPARSASKKDPVIALRTE